MLNRTKLLDSIRPTITTVIESSTVFEIFQSKTLRPILKFQNECLLLLFKHYLVECKIKTDSLTDEKKKFLIHTVLKKDLKLKTLLIGLIVGHFTIAELSFYCANRIETNKRIIELLIKRISDQKEQL